MTVEEMRQIVKEEQELGAAREADEIVHWLRGQRGVAWVKSLFTDRTAPGRRGDMHLMSSLIAEAIERGEHRK